jgi:hypothetical protein
MIEEIEHRDFKRCLKISNGDAEVMISLDFGPRILHYALDGGENVLGWHPEAAVQTEFGTWRAYGGSGRPDQNSRSAQIAVAERVRAASGGYGAWPVCGARA